MRCKQGNEVTKRQFLIYGKSISKSTINIQSKLKMQVENTMQNHSVRAEDSSSAQKEAPLSDSKQQRAENRIAKYEQKPERKASKMLVRLLQWADKLVLKYFTKKYLPEQLECFFSREARANKVHLQKAQIDYSVEDFAVRLYVFWVCQTYFSKNAYQMNLGKLLAELRDQLNRKRRNLQQSYETCQQETQKRQKQQQLKWMSAIINGLVKFIGAYLGLDNQEEILNFLLQITSNIMIDCLRKPGNKLNKKKEKLEEKIKCFRGKIAQILGSKERDESKKESEDYSNKKIQKTNIIIQANPTPITFLNSAFQPYKGENKSNGKTRQVVKNQQNQNEKIFDLGFKITQNNENLSKVSLLQAVKKDNSSPSKTLVSSFTQSSNILCAKSSGVMEIEEEKVQDIKQGGQKQIKNQNQGKMQEQLEIVPKEQNVNSNE